jgi:small multidrug resistance family-3 protein
MNTLTTLSLLFTAALLEAGGDALVRKGLHSSAVQRAGFLLTGGLVLFAYGCTVNAPPWDFGRLLGIYVVFFFIAAQIINCVAFGQMPTARIVLAGMCIIAGGLILSGKPW